MTRENQTIPRLPHPDCEIYTSSSNYAGILDHIFSVSLIKYKKNGNTIEDSSASGFFFKYNKQLYFITNKHVVYDKTEKHEPDELILKLHTDRKDFTKSKEHPIALYKNGKRVWLEYSEEDMNIDIVAIPIDVPEEFYITFFEINDFILEDRNFDSIHVPVGEDILVVGYPDGIYDSAHNLPIIRRGSLASVYPFQHQNQKGRYNDCYFLIDSLLHGGSSGSPVLLKSGNIIRKDKVGGRVVGMFPKKRCLIGIHSGDFDGKKQELGLYKVYFAELIPLIIDGEKMDDI